MARPRKPVSGFPDKQEILGFISRHASGIGRREIAREFKIGAKDRSRLKHILDELEDEGVIALNRGSKFVRTGALPNVGVIEVTGTDENGDVVAQPLNWREDRRPPVIYVQNNDRKFKAPGAGDRLLARLTRLDDQTYEAAVMRRLNAGPKSILGVFDDDFRIHPVERGQRYDYEVPPDQTMGAEPGELVSAELMSRRRYGLPQAKVIERLGRGDGPSAYSHIAVHLHGIPDRFSQESLDEAAACGEAPLNDRVDLRNVPLVTIDGEDARDFDDAVFAEPVDPAARAGERQWHIIVAIADVAWYVRPGSRLDTEARDKGNSVYFPDRVVPMLPEDLSNGWCSLRPGEDRPCMAVHLWIDADGNPQDYRFERAMMRSHARLTYTQVQNAREGDTDETTAPLMAGVIEPLFGAFDSFMAARLRREPLDLQVPEALVIIDQKTGDVAELSERPQLDSHRLIEEFMIAANVAAATALEKAKQPFLYRIHDEPPADKMEAFREFAGSLGLKFPKGQVLTPGGFNQFVRRARELEMGPVISSAVLRSQSQAVYTGANDGHFGLALRRYCHFTSPIRRYADLVVHRALIEGLNLGAGGRLEDPAAIDTLGEHLSVTERRAAAAERETVDRFVAAYFQSHVGEERAGTISGVAQFGLFVTLSGAASEGLVPVRSLPNDRYIFDENRRLLSGQRTGLKFRMGDPIDVIIREANPTSGSLVLEALNQPTKNRRRRRK